jgi:hypothetical protein
MPVDSPPQACRTRPAGELGPDNMRRGQYLLDKGQEPTLTPSAPQEPPGNDVWISFITGNHEDL